jgi:hypothetical protein
MTAYGTPSAMWAAATARLKTESGISGRPLANLQREFLYSRLLARVFSPANPASERWVLKGGIALLTRVSSARHSKDIDLYLRDSSTETAITELQAAAAIDLEDHLLFATAPRGRCRRGATGRATRMPPPSASRPMQAPSESRNSGSTS